MVVILGFCGIEGGVWEGEGEGYVEWKEQVEGCVVGGLREDEGRKMWEGEGRVWRWDGGRGGGEEGREE